MTGVAGRLASLVPSERSFVGYLLWLSRPRFWLYLAGPIVVGVAYGATAASEFFGPLTVGLFAYFLVPANVFLYGVNDIFDAEIDEVNPKKSDEGREVQYTGGRGVVVVVVLSALLGLAFLPALPVDALLALGGFYLLGWAYSAPPFRLKTTPLLDSVSNGLYILPGVIGYATLAGTHPPVVAVAGGWIWAMGMHTFSAIPDIGPDRDAGVRTTATLLGERATLGYCAGCWLAAAGLMALLHPSLGLALGVYPAFVGVVVAADIAIDRAYWWFPVLNTAVGTVLTMGGIWRVLYA